MRDRTVIIKTTDGDMETFLTHPEGEGPFSAVVIYMDAPGIRDELLDFARRVATVGYYCAVPDLYYRHGRVRFGPEHRDDPDQLALRSSYRESLTNVMVMEDTQALLDFLAAGEPVRAGPKGAMGYCMGGAWSFAAGGVFPSEFRANASFHGTRLVSDAEDSPHLLIPNMQGEFYGGFAEDDPYVPLPEVEALGRALQESRDGALLHRLEVHPGTRHGYSFPASPAYRMEAAEKNWERAFGMFHRQLGANPPRLGGA